MKRQERESGCCTGLGGLCKGVATDGLHVPESWLYGWASALSGTSTASPQPKLVILQLPITARMRGEPINNGQS